MKKKKEPIDIRMVDRVQDGLSRRIGKSLAITGKRIKAILKAEGYKGVSDSKIREVIHYLRTERGLFICAEETGYYMANTQEEREHQIASLSSRIREIQEVKDALIRNLQKNTPQGQLFEN